MPYDTSSPTAKRHRTQTLNTRKVLDFLRAHPGSTNSEIKDATGYGPTRLQQLGMAKWRRVDGVTRWYLTSEIARPREEEKTERMYEASNLEAWQHD